MILSTFLRFVFGRPAERGTVRPVNAGYANRPEAFRKDVARLMDRHYSVPEKAYIDQLERDLAGHCHKRITPTAWCRRHMAARGTDAPPR